MNSKFRCAGLLALSACAAWSQSTPASATFVAASVKPAPPPEMGRMMVRMAGGPGTPSPGQITYTNVSLKNVIMNAYNVKGYQISGPSWLDSERFDIVAKIPPGATREEFRLMLQNLLAERFKLALHHDTKELPVYALVVGKNGLKMKESAKEDPAAAPAAGPDAGPPQIKMGKDGMPQLPAGNRPGTMMMMSAGKMKMQSTRQSIGGLTDMLSNQLGRPVIDETKLTALYDFTLEFAPGDGIIMAGHAGAMPAPPADGGFGGPSAGGSDDQGGPTLVTAVQEQLGLKLESKKGPVDMLVIDKLEKTPTEN